MEPFLGQLLLDVDPEHVDADAGKRTAPTVRNEELVLGVGVRTARRTLRRFRRAGRTGPRRSRFVRVPVARLIDVLHLLVEPHQLVAHVRQKQLIDLVQLGMSRIVSETVAIVIGIRCHAPCSPRRCDP